MSDERGREVRSAILQAHKDGLLLENLFGTYARRTDTAHAEIVDALAELHNEGRIDLLQPLLGDVPKRGSHFFLGMALYCELIPKIDASTEDMIVAVRGLVAAGGDDMAANQPHGAFRQWCSQARERVDEVIALANTGSEDARALLCFALEAGALIDPDAYVAKAIDATEATDERQLAGVVALSRISFTEDDSRADAAARAIERVVGGSSDENVRLNALRAGFEVAAKAPSTKSVALGLLDSFDPADPMVVHSCAQLLAYSADAMNDDLVDALLRCVANVDPANKGTIDSLDFGLRQLWVRDQHARVIRVLEEILPRAGAQLLKALDSLTHEVLTGDRHPLEEIVVRWFLAAEHSLCTAIADLIGRPMDNFEFSIDFERFNLEEQQWAFLGRKAVGYFILYPTTAASFLVSLLRHAPASQVPALTELLFDPILLNYSGDARDYCERIAKAANDSASTAVAEALARQVRYLDDLRSVGEVRELHPSERRRQTEHRRQRDAMNAAYKAAEKRTILSMIATRRVLLYGNRSIAYFNGPNNEKHRTEMELKSISASFEFPRIEIVDPMGLQYQLMAYRSER